jgi:hypothetical protein
MRKPAVTRHVGLALIGVVALSVVVFAGNSVLGRGLTGRERALVGTWSFFEPDDPHVRIVYRFHPNGRATEEHYDLKSARPTVPTIRMEGVWHVESDGTLVAEAATGPVGWWLEAARWGRETAGQPGNSHRMLRRFYRDTRVDEAGLHARVSRSSRSGKSQTVELVMEPVDSARR